MTHSINLDALRVALQDRAGPTVALTFFIEELPHG